MRGAKGLVEHPRSWREIPGSGAVFAVGAEAGTVVMEWRTAPGGEHVDVYVRRALRCRRRCWSAALDPEDFQLRLFNRIRASWDPCIYPFGFPLDEGGAR
ncbi:hypothetical protein [Streptomonospora arabica]|uniref:Uncharacterized protein n=1 Tax=Streptomonospora arabica TaxID=412417 RepID=A0ABV9SR89_9ACTN